jgi:anti-sigma regulatory factor (Ser/Thr protein kinase)
VGPDGSAAGRISKGVGTTASPTFELMVPANRERIGAARSALRAWLTDHAMDPDRIMDVLLVVSEALTNAAEHGHRFDESPIELHATWSANELMVMVSDTGEWGLPHAMADRGRGVGIIRALADEASIDNTHRGTTVRVSFSLGQVQHQPADAGQAGGLGTPDGDSGPSSAVDSLSGIDSMAVDPSAGFDDPDTQITDLLAWLRARDLVGCSV